MAKAWLVPLALGVAGMLTVLLWPHPPGPAPSTDFATPFPTARGPLGAQFDALIVAPHGRLAAIRALSNASAAAYDTIQWHGDVGTFREAIGVPACATCPAEPWRTQPWPYPVPTVAPDGEPRFGRDGHNATRMTVYVFLADGRLLASNADAGNVSRFQKDGEFRALDPVVWYLGDAAAPPPGTQLLPSVVQPVLRQLRPLMTNLTVGGVQSAHVASYPGDFLFGPLEVTVRIETLVRAP